MSWLKQKTELGKLFVVPNTVRGCSGGSPRAKQSRGPLPQRKGVAAPSQCAGVQDQSIVNHHIPLTYIVFPLRLSHRGSYGVSSGVATTTTVRGTSVALFLPGFWSSAGSGVVLVVSVALYQFYGFYSPQDKIMIE